ncbi:MAG: formylglycine-generating enzyme family protein [Chloroflexota bacterium]|nr:formylglycine-generating enzyme family protein [Chloroflexota bacterium]
MKSAIRTILGVFFLLLAACAPTPTETPLPAPTPTVTALPTATPTTTSTTTPLPLTKQTPIQNDDSAPMVQVPAGDFIMGNNKGNDDEKPAHTIYLDVFWMDKYLVTNALYKKCVDAGKCATPFASSSVTRASYYGNTLFDNYPAIYVTWFDANTFCAWAGKRLPTEAEWEKAGRGTDARTYPWGSTFDANKLNANSPYGNTTAVGNFPLGASPYGAMDMAGNVWEWVADWYDSGYYSVSPRNNPKGPTTGQWRVLRGGAWDTDQQTIRISFRHAFIPEASHFSFGFRCAR